MTIGIYAGSFDPITNGHIDIINRALAFCDQLIVVVGVNSAKKTMFSEEERLTMIREVISKELKPQTQSAVSCWSYQGLMVNFAQGENASVMIRGIRSVSDFEYEINLANINKTLAPNVETIFLPTKPDMAVVSSSAAKEIAKCGGDISKFVPPYVAKAIHAKFGFVKTGE